MGLEGSEDIVIELQLGHEGGMGVDDNLQGSPELGQFLLMVMVEMNTFGEILLVLQLLLA